MGINCCNHKIQVEFKKDWPSIALGSAGCLLGSLGAAVSIYGCATAAQTSTAGIATEMILGTGSCIICCAGGSKYLIEDLNVRQIYTPIDQQPQVGEAMAMGVNPDVVPENLSTLERIVAFFKQPSTSSSLSHGSPHVAT